MTCATRAGIRSPMYHSFSLPICSDCSYSSRICSPRNWSRLFRTLKEFRSRFPTCSYTFRPLYSIYLLSIMLCVIGRRPIEAEAVAYFFCGRLSTSQSQFGVCLYGLRYVHNANFDFNSRVFFIQVLNSLELEIQVDRINLPPSRQELALGCGQ